MMKLKIKNTFVLFCSTITLPVFSECIDGKIKYIADKKEVIVNESYCYELSSKLFISSKACHGNKVCQSKNLGTIEIKMSEMTAATGPLGFKICEKFHGKPQQIEYLAQDKWTSVGRCLFSDGSFIDNATLAQKVNYVD